MTTNTTRELAEAIYSECYGHLDDKYHSADKTQEIQDWLNDGDTAEALAQTAQQLAAEWREYAAGDKNIKLAAAAAIGRLGGRSTSTAKAAAAAVNGRKGGRPAVTRNTVDRWLEENAPGLGSFEFGNNKGVFDRRSGPAASFETLGKTWKIVLDNLKLK